MAATRDTPPAGRAVQWNDLQTNQRKIVSDNIRDAGRNMPRLAQEHVAGVARSKTTTPGKVATAQKVADAVRSKPVSLQSAANSREKLYNAAVNDRAAANPGDKHQVIPTGAGWYFEHHREIAASATQHGADTDRAIAASGVMSPQNSPENERAAVHAIMDAKANHTLNVTPEVHAHLARKGVDVTEHVGKTVSIGSLPVGTVAHLSDSSVRSKMQSHTSADLTNIARGGTKENIVKAERVLGGEVHPDDAVNPHSAPKVWSYVHNTRQAVPNSPTHVEFMGRIHQDALVRRGQIDKHQQSLDLYGHGEQTGGHLLSPESHTVEDTWQNAATFDQPKTTASGSKTSVFKAAGSLTNTYPVAGVKTRVNEETGKRDSAFRHPDVGNAGLTHAFNNRATQKAAEQLSKQSGTTVPPVAVQEVGWVQMRKDAGKDSAFNAEQRAKPKNVDPNAGQGVLPGMEGLINDRRGKR